MGRLVGVVFLVGSLTASAQELTADTIMRKLAENQAATQTARAQYVYDQSIRVISRYGTGKVAREETATYTVTPKEKTTGRELVSYSGRYWHKGEYHPISGKPVDDPDGMEAGVVASFRRDITQDDTKDGLAAGMFPLDAQHQIEMAFHLEGERTVNGRAAYVVEFGPKNPHDYGWKGEVLVDKEEFQPVTVYTRMNRKLPLFVRTLLDTDVPDLGFETQYTRVDKNVWFPRSFGTEFRAHAVFFFRRRYSISMENKNFRKANVDTTIHYDSIANSENRRRSDSGASATTSQ